MNTVLSLTDLAVELGPKSARRQVVRGVTMDLVAGRIQGLAGSPIW